jgi:Na+/proline symporter
MSSTSNPNSLFVYQELENTILFIFKGIPNEIYTYGTQMFVTIIGIGIGVLISGEIWIPILYRLKVVSIYEYFELRYKSKFPRRLMTAIFILKVNV